MTILISLENHDLIDNEFYLVEFDLVSTTYIRNKSIAYAISQSLAFQ